MSPSLRPTCPPSARDARALAVSAAYLGPWQAQARGVLAVLEGRLPALPTASEAWLKDLAGQSNRRGELAATLLADLGRSL